MLDCPFDGTEEAASCCSQRVPEQFQDVKVRERGLLLNRSSDCRSVAETILAGKFRLVRVKDYGMRRSRDVGMTRVNARIDDRDLQTITDHAGTAHSAIRPSCM